MSQTTWGRGDCTDDGAEKKIFYWGVCRLCQKGGVCIRHGAIATEEHAAVVKDDKILM